MLIKIRQILATFLLLTLAACGTVTPAPPTALSSSAVPPTQAYPLATPSPEPTQSPTTLPPPSDTPTPKTTPPPPSIPTPPSSPYDQLLADRQISYLRMFDANTGWATYSPHLAPGYDSQILRTTSGIQTWNDVTPPVSENDSQVRAAYFIDADTAVVVSTHSNLPLSPAPDAFVWRTVDGGQTWQLGETSDTITGILDFTPFQLVFIDAQLGWLLAGSDFAMGNARLHFFATQDGGMHWEKVYDTVDHIGTADELWISGFYPYSAHLTFVSGEAGFFSDGSLRASQDGGASWTLRTLDPPDDLPDVKCEPGHGSKCPYLDTVSAPRFTSPQDGVLIRRVYLNSETTLDAFIFYRPGTTNRIPFPIGQYIYYTHDGGQTWIPGSSPVKMGTVFFLDAQVGWTLGKNEADPQAPTLLYQTTDGGGTWVQLTGDSPLLLGSTIQFLDGQTGFAFSSPGTSDFYIDFDARLRADGQNSLLFMTNDGGYSWTAVEPQIIP